MHRISRFAIINMIMIMVLSLSFSSYSSSNTAYASHKTTHKKVVIKKHAKKKSKKKVSTYSSVDAFGYGASKHPTANASDKLVAPAGFLFSFNSSTNQFEQADNYSNDFIKKSHKVNVFHPNTSDTKRMVNPTNLDTNTQRELSQYTADLINQLSQKLSNNQAPAKLIVTDRALAAATQIANGYSADKWDIDTQNDHDLNVLKSVFGQYNSNGWAENWAGSTLGKKNSIANIKENIYGSTASMMFDDADSGWGHTANFLGASLNATHPLEFAISIDNLNQLHFEFLLYN